MLTFLGNSLLSSEKMWGKGRNCGFFSCLDWENTKATVQLSLAQLFGFVEVNDGNQLEIFITSFCLNFGSEI